TSTSRFRPNRRQGRRSPQVLGAASEAVVVFAPRQLLSTAPRDLAVHRARRRCAVFPVPNRRQRARARPTARERSMQSSVEPFAGPECRTGTARPAESQRAAELDVRTARSAPVRPERRALFTTYYGSF